MPRRAPVIALDDERRAALRHLLSAPTTSQGLVVRLMIVLKASEGESNQAIASGLGVTCATVGKWRQAFADRGLEGLRDRPRPGRPRKYGPEVLERIRTGLPRCRRSRFGVSVRSLARETNVPRSSLHHFLTCDRRRLAGNWSAPAGHVPGARTLGICAIYLTPRDRALIVGGRSVTGAFHLPAGSTRVFVRMPPRSGGRNRATIAALTQAAAPGDAWKPRRGKAATLADFITAVAAASGYEDLHVIRTGRRRLPTSLSSAIVRVHDLPADVWSTAVGLVLTLCRLHAERPASPGEHDRLADTVAVAPPAPAIGDRSSARAETTIRPGGAVVRPSGRSFPLMA